MMYTNLSQLPLREAERWEAAHVGDDGKKRQVARKYAASNGTTWETLEEFLTEVNERLARWRSGQYVIQEAAQILADSNPTINPGKFCEQMEMAGYIDTQTAKTIGIVKLKMRENGILIPGNALPYRSMWTKTVRQDDVNEWLQETGAGYKLTYPYLDTYVESQALEVVNRSKWWAYTLEYEEAQQEPAYKAIYDRCANLYDEREELLQRKCQDLPYIDIKIQKRLSEIRYKLEELEQDAPVTTHKQNYANCKSKVGRPKINYKKAEILRQLINVMAVGSSLDFTELPGSAPNLLEACKRIEKAKTGKTSMFETTTDTFKEWLKKAGCSFSYGRTKKAEKNYWTTLCVETMAKMPPDLFR